MGVVDHYGKVPVWRQVYLLLREQITSGEVAPGRAIASRKTIAQTHGVAETTVAKAVAALVRDGYLEGVQGHGVFVTEPEHWRSAAE